MSKIACNLTNSACYAGKNGSAAYRKKLFCILKKTKNLLTEFDCRDNINRSLTATQNIEAWLSLVERYIRDVEVAGSNPVASIFFDSLSSGKFFSEDFLIK